MSKFPLFLGAAVLGVLAIGNKAKRQGTPKPAGWKPRSGFFYQRPLSDDPVYWETSYAPATWQDEGPWGYKWHEYATGKSGDFAKWFKSEQAAIDYLKKTWGDENVTERT